MPTLPSRFSHCFLLGAFGVLFFTNPVIAQDTDTETKEPETTQDVRLGFHIGLSGLVRYVAIRNVYSSADDIMSYPLRFWSLNYNKKYQSTIAWDNKDDNEKMFIFSMRYNYYPFEEELYLFLGPVIWRFDKKYSYRLSAGEIHFDMDTGDGPIVKTDRPDGRSITLGITGGFGWDYKVFGLILSHEIEIYLAPCTYDEFICRGWDIKPLGVHFEF